MKVRIICILGTLISLCGLADELAISNSYLSRTFSIEEGVFKTVSIQNKMSGETIIPEASPEFGLRVSQGTDTIGTDVNLTSKDFLVKKVAIIRLLKEERD